jgi:hypothetical protein
MRAPCTLTEAVLIVGLCLFAIGSARAVVSVHQEEGADRIAINRVDAHCPDAPREEHVHAHERKCVKLLPSTATGASQASGGLNRAINNSHFVRHRTDDPVADEHSQTRRISATATCGSSFATFSFCALRGFRLFTRGIKGNVSETHFALLLSALGWR